MYCKHDKLAVPVLMVRMHTVYTRPANYISHTDIISRPISSIDIHSGRRQVSDTIVIIK